MGRWITRSIVSVSVHHCLSACGGNPVSAKLGGLLGEDGKGGGGREGGGKRGGWVRGWQRFGLGVV